MSAASGLAIRDARIPPYRARPAPGTKADDEARTRDPQLGKLMLYQLSYVRNALWRLAASVCGPGGDTS